MRALLLILALAGCAQGTYAPGPIAPQPPNAPYNLQATPADQYSQAVQQAAIATHMRICGWIAPADATGLLASIRRRAAAGDVTETGAAAAVTAGERLATEATTRDCEQVKRLGAALPTGSPSPRRAQADPTTDTSLAAISVVELGSCGLLTPAERRSTIDIIFRRATQAGLSSSATAEAFGVGLDMATRGYREPCTAVRETGATRRTALGLPAKMPAATPTPPIQPSADWLHDLRRHATIVLTLRLCDAASREDVRDFSRRAYAEATARSVHLDSASLAIRTGYGDVPLLLADTCRAIRADANKLRAQVGMPPVTLPPEPPTAPRPKKPAEVEI